MEVILDDKKRLLLNKLIDYKDKDVIKIITGIRCCGKSFLLFNIYYNYFFYWCN